MVKSEFLKSGWRYLDLISGGPVCNNGSCLRCRLAKILFEVESTIEKNPSLKSDGLPFCQCEGDVFYRHNICKRCGGWVNTPTA